MFSFFIFRKFLKIAFIVWLVSILPVLIYIFVNPPFTMIQNSQSELRGEKGRWIPIEEIPKHFQLAALAGEDQIFFDHWGFDFGAIEKAIEHNARSSKTRGASTISQQTAKNVFCWEGRSWIRKGIETYYTCMIELFWSKKRILEVYLNVIEMGRGAFGVDEAAQYYFKIPAEKLNRQQSIIIISMLPCPRTCGINSPMARNRQYLINYAMRRYGLKLKY